MTIHSSVIEFLLIWVVPLGGGGGLLGDNRGLGMMWG